MIIQTQRHIFGSAYHDLEDFDQDVEPHTRRHKEQGAINMSENPKLLRIPPILTYCAGGS